MLCALFLLIDGMQGYYQGPIRALGLQHTAGWIAIGAYWGLGVPFAFIFVRKFNWGVPGLEMGLCIAYVAQFISYLIVTYTYDWQKIADEAAERINKEAEVLETIRIETEMESLSSSVMLRKKKKKAKGDDLDESHVNDSFDPRV